MFSFIISGQSGLVKVNETSSTADIINKLSTMSMVGIFSFSLSFEDEFVRFMEKNKGDYRVEPENFIIRDSSYFSLIIDGDNLETESGLMAILSYGNLCPSSLKDISKNFGQYGYLGEKILHIE